MIQKSWFSFHCIFKSDGFSWIVVLCCFCLSLKKLDCSAKPMQSCATNASIYGLVTQMLLITEISWSGCKLLIIRRKNNECFTAFGFLYNPINFMLSYINIYHVPVKKFTMYCEVVARLWSCTMNLPLAWSLCLKCLYKIIQGNGRAVSQVLFLEAMVLYFVRNFVAWSIWAKNSPISFGNEIH
jgi:hypothetical protein